MADETDRGRALVYALVRSAVMVTALLVVYYQAPLDRPLSAATAVIFLAGLLLLGVAVVVEVRGILGSARPRLRAIRTLAVGLPLLLVVFAATYDTIDSQQAGAFTEPLSRTDALYFTVTTFATVGYGDIAPTTQLTRVLVTFQMVIGLLTVGVLAKVVLGAVRVAEERHTRSRGPGEHVGTPGPHPSSGPARTGLPAMNATEDPP